MESIHVIVKFSCQKSLCNIKRHDKSGVVTGKVSDVIRTKNSNKPDLHFDYDAMGQRIAKTVTNKNTTDGTDKFVTTYYVRDPQGNVLAVISDEASTAAEPTIVSLSVLFLPMCLEYM